jgi:putative hydrolase of the HAD superfamily
MFASYKIKLTKPKEEVFKYVMENAPLKPEETLFVDDGAKNIETAQRLGFHTYQPQNGENWIAKLEELLGWR